MIHVVLENDPRLVRAAEADRPASEYGGPVLTRAWQLARTQLIDLGIVGLAVANEIEIGVTHVPMNRAVQIPLSLFWAAPLLARRRYPLGAPLLVFASFALDASLDPHGLENLNVAFICALAAILTAGAIG